MGAVHLIALAKDRFRFKAIVEAKQPFIKRLTDDAVNGRGRSDRVDLFRRIVGNRDFSCLPLAIGYHIGQCRTGRIQALRQCAAAQKR